MSDHSDDTWFDREMCPPPCDAMHERYACCGAPVEDCAHDSSQHREVATLAELLQTRGILTDLIAELRDETGTWFPAGAALRVEAMVNRAEARLKEVQGE